VLDKRSEFPGLSTALGWVRIMTEKTILIYVIVNSIAHLYRSIFKALIASIKHLALRLILGFCARTNAMHLALPNKMKSIEEIRRERSST
jgi:hypothetical protein